MVVHPQPIKPKSFGGKRSVLEFDPGPKLANYETEGDSQDWLAANICNAVRPLGNPSTIGKLAGLLLCDLMWFDL